MDGLKDETEVVLEVVKEDVDEDEDEDAGEDTVEKTTVDVVVLDGKIVKEVVDKAVILKDSTVEDAVPKAVDKEDTRVEVTEVAFAELEGTPVEHVAVEVLDVLKATEVGLVMVISGTDVVFDAEDLIVVGIGKAREDMIDVDNGAIPVGKAVENVDLYFRLVDSGNVETDVRVDEREVILGAATEVVGDFDTGVGLDGRLGGGGDANVAATDDPDVFDDDPEGDRVKLVVTLGILAGLEVRSGDETEVVKAVGQMKIELVTVTVLTASGGACVVVLGLPWNKHISYSCVHSNKLWKKADACAEVATQTSNEDTEKTLMLTTINLQLRERKKILHEMHEITAYLHEKTRRIQTLKRMRRHEYITSGHAARSHRISQGHGISSPPALCG
ncbi:hypothetical protein MMC25_001933 [Agyrium rufum]|nr:hypothetical protein [Agyrium rufum]